MFNIYYVNFPKVYELKMMLSNVISIGGEIQEDSKKEKNTDFTGKLGLQYLSMFNAEFGANRKNSSANSKKVLETFEVKSTKSLILSEVLSKSKVVDDFTKIEEGQLIKVNDLDLSLVNEAELRTVKLFVNGNFKGMVIPGHNDLDVGSLINSLVKDYSYKLKGEKDGIDVLMKIPLSFESEFENSYSIDDLFIGNVAVVGLYKGKVKIDALKNSFEFFQEFGSTTKEKGKEDNIINSQSSEKEQTNKLFQRSYSEDDREYHYIDLLAIIQNIKLPASDTEV